MRRLTIIAITALSLCVALSPVVTGCSVGEPDEAATGAAAQTGSRPVECRDRGIKVPSAPDSTRVDCTVTGLGADGSKSKSLAVLTLRGDAQTTSAAHGYLMGEEMMRGPVKETIDLINTGLADASPILHRVFECAMRRAGNGVGPDFAIAVERLRLGAIDRLKALGTAVPPALMDAHAFAQAALAIDVNIALEGIQNRIETGDYDALNQVDYLHELCPGAVTNGLVDSVFGARGRAPTPSQGCTGFTVPAAFSSEGRLLHARNLDGDLMDSWTDAPTVLLVDEATPAERAARGDAAPRAPYRYAGIAAAGVFYGAGISGFNEMGIAASLHEMQTTKFKLDHAGGAADLGPMLQQRVLREAKSIEEAVAIVRQRGRIGGWGLFISDAKTNESATIELTGERVSVTRSSRNPTAQTNHFLSDDMRDQFFNYNFNKVLESYARRELVQKKLRSRQVGEPEAVSFAIDLLANHDDVIEGPSSFGRTVTKAYTHQSVVMEAPATPGQTGRVWVTLADKLPVSHSTFLGLEVDFDKMSASPLRTLHASAKVDGFEQALGLYTRSRIDYARERVLEDGARKAAAQVEQAISLARSEPPSRWRGFVFMLGRTLHLLGDEAAKNDHASESRAAYEKAMSQWNELLSGTISLAGLDEYALGLIEMYAVTTSDRLPERHAAKLSSSRRQDLASSAARRLGDIASGKALAARSIGDVAPAFSYVVKYDLHTRAKRADIEAKAALASSLEASTSAKRLPPLDFVVVYQ
jgi:hypothetical protein